MGVRKLPFASAYVPAEQVNPLPLLLLPFGLGMAYALARLERYSLSDGRLVTFLTAAGAAVVAVVAVRALDMWQRRT
jgi:hypothetical protein